MELDKSFKVFSNYIKLAIYFIRDLICCVIFLVDTSKKVFAQNEKQEEDGSSEFSQARQAALAEAMEAKTKVTKTFTQVKKTTFQEEIPLRKYY